MKIILFKKRIGYLLFVFNSRDGNSDSALFCICVFCRLHNFNAEQEEICPPSTPQCIAAWQCGEQAVIG